MTREDEPKDASVTNFPTEKERKRLEKERLSRQRAPSEPVINLPPVVKVLCLINAVVFLFGYAFPGLWTDETVYALAFVPARYFGNLPLGMAGVTSLITHMFLHAGWLHLAVNVGTLMAFGTGIEKALGGRKFLLFYFATGLCGAALHAVIYPDMEVPMLGASGAISGLFGGILIVMYMQGMMGQGYRKLLPFILIWLAMTAFFGFFGVAGTDNPVAWATHMGGFVSGLFLYKPISRLKIQH